VRVFTAGHTFASLRLRDYRLLCLGQFSTSMGQWMDQMTRSWLMYQITGSALQLGVATALRGLPICEVCSVNIPGRPGDPDGLCKLHAEVDEEFNR